MWKYLVLVIAACGGTSASDIDAPAGGDASSQCKPQVTTGLSSGHHNAGQDCMGSCHNHGFTAAGTVFQTAASNTPITGATITITDDAGHTITAVSQLNGNFYTSTPLTFPINMVASSCPNLTQMTAALPAAQGCNASLSCHGGTQGHIHLP